MGPVGYDDGFLADRENFVLGAEELIYHVIATLLGYLLPRWLGSFNVLDVGPIHDNSFSVLAMWGEW